MQLIRDTKVPFNAETAIRLFRAVVAPFPKAAMFELSEEGHSSVFEQLIACIISIRTRDESSLVIARRLFSVARTAEDIAKLSVEQLDRLIALCARNS